ncbi:MAG: sporulation protein [Methylotenera sp.]|uniref:sporulation protein n=1 Tax=Methylotenera sp. TaxID=2051956 RepID=UPI000D468A97|nr:sporulation protein [Methylotenera sp.]PPC83575.1 MAG: sporulation protein [Methylotenera sp.]
MKYLFGLLLLINIGLFGYFNRDVVLPKPAPTLEAEISPEKIKILSPEEVEALAVEKKPVVVAPPPVIDVCFEWSVFSEANLSNAQMALQSLTLKATVKEQTVQSAKRFWVYKPPVKSSAEALKKAAEFKEMGITDVFVVQEPKWKNAISFGIFSDEQLAINLQKELQAKGIKNVEKALRSQGKSYSSLLLKNLNETEIAEIKKLKPSFPAAELKEVSCEAN